jgi:HJR/Mrr/RecB family endonuclease
MGDVHARVERYCAAMQSQPQEAESIRQDLIATLNDGKAVTVDNRNAALNALAVSAQMQQAQAAMAAATRPTVVVPSNSTVHCTSQRSFNQVYTDCQ